MQALLRPAKLGLGFNRVIFRLLEIFLRSSACSAVAVLPVPIAQTGS